jgi:hypothetical protein
MPSDELNRRLEDLRKDFQAERGFPFQHFFCPILHTDEPATICKGHVIPAAFGSCNAWLPQRKDVDNFFGAAVEAGFTGVVQDRGKTSFEKWLDPAARKRHKPRIEFEGETLEHYFPIDGQRGPGHTQVTVIGDAGEKICNVIVKKSREEMVGLHGKDVRLVIKRDYRPEVIGSLLKAAHLTLFQLLGYRHVFSPTGIYLADILRRFYLIGRDTNPGELGKQLAAHFLPHGGMILPILVRDASVLGGTVKDGRVLMCIGGSEGAFALGVVVVAGSEAFCVFLPTDDGRTISTYFSFLNEPPESIAVRLLEYRPATETKESHWATNPGDPIRIQLPHAMPSSAEPH